MALRPPVQSVAPLIRRLAPGYGIDPRAAIAVALGEGGLQNRANDIGDLSGGGSYGPFQLYAKGALPQQFRGRANAADSWAWSPQGIKYALGRMKAAGASGLTGPAAVNAIVRKFERPAAPDKSVAAALGRLSSIGGGGSASSPALRATPRTLGTPAINQSTPSGQPLNPRRNALLQGLIGGQNIYDLIQTLPGLQASVSASKPRPLNTRLGTSKALKTSHRGHSVDQEGREGSWTEFVGTPERRSGPSAPHKPRTLEFVGRVGEVAGTKLTPWGNESHSLTTTSGRPSQHGTGDAADIPASGAELIRIGRAALVAAGADPAWARKQTGGLFNINGKQIIFATNSGGNHFDHVHVGL